MTRIAHVSDPHFGTEEAPVLAALRADLLAARPDLMILTGDVTQRARPGQFRAARSFLDSLAPLPALALPGNHDLPLFDLVTRLTSPYRQFRKHIAPDLSPTWQDAEVAVLGVNSTRPLRHKNGVLDIALVERVAERLAALPQPFKIVALHHPLVAVEDSDRENLARGAERALAAWILAGADLLLGGHIHLPYCVPADSGARRAVILQAGTAVSRRRRGGQPNSYHLIELECGALRRMEITQRDYDPGRGVFARRRGWRGSPAGSGWDLSAG